MMTEILDIERLNVSFRTPRGHLKVLRNISLNIAAGEALGLVGESGSGKSTLAYAIMRYLAGNAVIEEGRILFEQENLLDLPEGRMRQLRGRRIGMVYQDPGTALNPSMRLGDQIVEILVYQQGLRHREAWRDAEEMLDRVNLPDPRFMSTKFPHEVSGGEKQRVLIAMAFACQPVLLIFDEPTTALDATTAAGIIDLIQRLQQETGAAVLYITHDLGIIRNIAHRISIIYAGSFVEEGDVDAVFRNPHHPYTRALLASVPKAHTPGRRLTSFGGLAPDLHEPPEGCIFQSRCPFVDEQCREGEIPFDGTSNQRAACVRLDDTRDRALPKPKSRQRVIERSGTEGDVIEVQDLKVNYGRAHLLDQLLRRPSPIVRAVQGVSLTLHAGETLGLVGESGCGKSTLAKALVGLEKSSGSIGFDGSPIDWDSVADQRRYRPNVQIIFQHPDLSLNPRMRIGQILSRPIRLYGTDKDRDIMSQVGEWLERVRLPSSYIKRYPHELSGGEKQRIAIARAFAAQPRVVICDEITSGLDVSVQASIINLLFELQEEFGTAYLFVSHDLNLVQHFADRVAVMYLGRIVELRSSTHIFRPPYHPYTEALLSAAPSPDPEMINRRIRLTGTLPSPMNPPSGCAFHTRCPHRIGPICDVTAPPVRTISGNHWLTCHLPDKELSAMPEVWQHRRDSKDPGPEDPALVHP